MSEELKPCPYVIAGPWTDDDGQTFIEIQRAGGHELIAQIYADKAEAARLMAEQAVTAWNTRAAMQTNAAPVAWMYERGSERKAYVERSQAALACGYAETPLYAHPPVADRVSTSSPVDDRETGNTSGKDLIADAISDSLGPDWTTFDAAHHVMQRLTDEGLCITQAPARGTDCPASHDGFHHVDTSMESWPNNCFHCERPI